MSKRYFWLKLNENFFESDTMSWLEEQPNGKDYSLLYLKLCLKSIKTNGILIRKVGQMLLPYDAKTLSKLTNTEYDTVIVAMELYKKIGLVRILENGEIYLPELEKMVGSETNKAELMRKKRARDKQNKLNGNIVTEALPNSYTEKEKEKDKEKYKEKYKEKNIDKDYKKTIDIYNETCVSLPKVRRLTPKRESELEKTFCQLSIKDLKDVFIKTEESSFLTGNNKNGWTASFDWLIKYENAVKVLEDNYKDKVKVIDKKPDNPFVALALDMEGDNE